MFVRVAKRKNSVPWAKDIERIVRRHVENIPNVIALLIVDVNKQLNTFNDVLLRLTKLLKKKNVVRRAWHDMAKNISVG